MEDPIKLLMNLKQKKKKKKLPGNRDKLKEKLGGKRE
jgi:hypothetical protein